ncbi:hypothetical protein H0H92_004241 [Tricholoma furcatifolium]|nr:hypothetical protein H0H92_004241 [Tricholoma furcatifolium]
MSDVRNGKTERLQEFEALVNIQHLLDDGGKDWFHHMERFAASVVLAAGFGMHCPTGHEPELRDILDISNELAKSISPFASIINIFPMLDWIPGPMPWRTRARVYHEREKAIYKKLIDEALVGRGFGVNTWAAIFASENKPEGDQRRLLKSFAGTSIVLQTFILACIRYPEWIAAAHKEIDNVVGPTRLPSFKDRPFLPYIDAVVREVLRWRPVARLGLPHQTTTSDVIKYQGRQYLVAEGSVIFAVIWQVNLALLVYNLTPIISNRAIEHDPFKFEDPDRFMPERFVDAEGRLKPNYQTSAFGFGRRMCPGIPFAERSLWIAIATMLWTFDIVGSKLPDPKTGLFA